MDMKMDMEMSTCGAEDGVSRTAHRDERRGLSRARKFFIVGVERVEPRLRRAVVGVDALAAVDCVRLRRRRSRSASRRKQGGTQARLDRQSVVLTCEGG